MALLHSKRQGFWLSLFCFLTLLSQPASVFADAKSEYLIRLLVKSSQFRVRAQAAISLGRIRDDPKVIAALIASLRDSHPAVKAASASSLERLGDPSAINALKAVRSDPEIAVKKAVERAISSLEKIAAKQAGRPYSDSIGRDIPRGPAKYYVGVGLPAAKAKVNKKLLIRAHNYIKEELKTLDGIMVAEVNEDPKKVKAVIKKKRLTGFYLDSSVVQIEKRPDGGTRAVVSIIVGTYPGRDMRSILQGAATVLSSGPETEFHAIQGAFKGALRRLPQALDRAVK